MCDDSARLRRSADQVGDHGERSIAPPAFWLDRFGRSQAEFRQQPRNLASDNARNDTQHGLQHLAAIRPADLAQRIGRRQCGGGRRCGDPGRMPADGRDAAPDLCKSVPLIVDGSA